AIARLEALARRSVRASGSARRRERKRAAREPLELLAGDEAFLDAQRCEARERALVVARGQVVPRVHAFDRVAILVHVDEAETRRVAEERVRAHLPGLVERPGVLREAHLAEALLAAEIVDAVHGYRRATPIRPSRVTMPASFSSGQLAVCA